MKELLELVKAFEVYNNKLLEIGGAVGRFEITHEEYYLHYEPCSSYFNIAMNRNKSYEYILSVAVNTNNRPCTEIMLNDSTVLTVLTPKHCEDMKLKESSIGTPVLLVYDEHMKCYKLLSVLDNEDTIFQMDSQFNVSNYIPDLNILPRTRIIFKTYHGSKDTLKFFTEKFKELTNGLGTETYMS